jgi:hypothetical protein
VGGRPQIPFSPVLLHLGLPLAVLLADHGPFLPVWLKKPLRGIGFAFNN